MTYLSIVIPAYNEASAIKTGKLTQVKEWIAKHTFHSELIVVDDGSSDETSELADPIATRVIRVPHAGKAFAILAGIQQAKGEIVLITDMDQATPITEAAKLLKAISSSSDLAIGSRGLIRSGAPITRYAISWGHTALKQILFDLKFIDTQCGFKAVKRRAAIEIINNLKLFNPVRANSIIGSNVTSGFDVEFLFVAQRLGFRIHEVKVIWNYYETRRVNATKEIYRGVRDLLTILFYDLKGKYPSPQSR